MKAAMGRYVKGKLFGSFYQGYVSKASLKEVIGKVSATEKEWSKCEALIVGRGRVRLSKGRWQWESERRGRRVGRRGWEEREIKGREGMERGR